MGRRPKENFSKVDRFPIGTNYEGNVNQNYNEIWISLETCQNGYQQKQQQKSYLLVSMYRKTNPRKLLMRL